MNCGIPAVIGSGPTAMFHMMAALAVIGLIMDAASAAETASIPGPTPTVEAEEDVYQYTQANNGAGPMWCRGSTCLARSGNDLFASGIELIKDAKPLNNCRWLLFKRTPTGWALQQRDDTGRTREPSPIAAFPDGRLFLSANPTLTPPQTYQGPARPQVLQFSVGNTKAPSLDLAPVWQGTPPFTEHSYRSFAADGPNHELILFNNIGYTHAEWTFYDRTGRWSAQGKLMWPQGVEYPKPEPIRVCYPNVALDNRAVYFCGVSDIVEPYPEWREFKKQLTGKEWDYDFRRLLYTWTPDITNAKFHEWIEVASCDKTCGWLMPGDMWVDSTGGVHIVWTERALDERLRARFFPEAKQSQSLKYAMIRDGHVTARQTLVLAEEGKPGIVTSCPRFQVTPDQRLFVVYFAQGTGGGGQRVAENQLMELRADGLPQKPVRIPFRKPFTDFFTATTRGGSPLSDTLEMLGQRAGGELTISYAKVKIR